MTQSDWQNNVLRDLLRQTQAQLGGEGGEMTASDMSSSEVAGRGAGAEGEAEPSVAPPPAPGRAPLPRRRPNTSPSPDAGPGPSPSPPLDPDDDAAGEPISPTATPAPRRTASLAARLAAGRADRPTPPTDADAVPVPAASTDAPADAPPPPKPLAPKSEPGSTGTSPIPNVSIEIDKKATPTPAPPPLPDITDAVPVLVAATHSPAPDAPTPVPQADIRDAAPTPDAPAPPPNPPASHLPSAPPPSGLPAPYTPAPAPTPQPHAPAPHPPIAPTPRSRNPRLPAFTPESVPTVDPRLAGALGRAQRGDTVARRTGHSLRRLASSAAPGVSEETRLAREVQQPVANGRVVAVTSIRGGVGKTTVSALLARTLNHYRHDPVLALEADAALGTLPVRLGAESVRWSCPDLAQILKPSMRLTDVTGYLVPVTDGGWLLPASQGRVGAPLDIRTYRTVSLALRRYFAVTVVDCETLPGEVARTAMDTAHARVVVAPMTAEGVGGTRVVLDWLAQLPKAALASTVVALTSSAPDMTLDLKAATAHLRETGVAVVHLPYDRHLAAGGPIRTALLSEATRRATTGLAAEAVQRAAR
ncbi:hypothetical protein [Streptomyces sp. NBC_01445]|uniref:hypothetical protein n=1 Tax=Streptomyces sp. NBC_01445 TaxID=2903869 RepID=UPI002DDADE53|nr:hypothetical protein [Streptomyces sp. NBC_01445]WSE04142.1 hypothetical protein OG574_12700 [Streptomyces sp. NBC_01445]